MGTTHRALVTGASAGIGRVYAERLAQSGHDLVLVARRAALMAELAEQLTTRHGIGVEIIGADLSTNEGVAQVVDRIAQGSPIDFVVNSAGYAARGRAAELDPDALAAMIQVNVVALSRICRAALERMRQGGHGKIVNIGSATTFMVLPGNGGYSATKSFVNTFTRHIQLEAETSGIQAQLLVPGIVATDFHRIAGADLNAFPPERVMSATDLVNASMRAFATDEAVCIPSLPDINDWNAYLAAERIVAGNASRNHIAGRYQLPQSQMV